MAIALQGKKTTDRHRRIYYFTSKDHKLQTISQSSPNPHPTHPPLGHPHNPIYAHTHIRKRMQHWSVIPALRAQSFTTWANFQGRPLFGAMLPVESGIQVKLLVDLWCQNCQICKSIAFLLSLRSMLSQLLFLRSNARNYNVVAPSFCCRIQEPNSHSEVAQETVTTACTGAAL